MAEIRKHNPTTNAVAEALKAALGESVRPLIPGAAPRPAKPDQKSVSGTTVVSFTVTEPAE